METKTTTLGMKIKSLRKEHKLTQKELASQVNALLPEENRYVTPQNVSGWEVNGYVPRTETLRALAAVLRVDVNYLMGSPDIQSDQAADFGEFTRVNREEILLYAQRPLFLRRKDEERGHWVIVDDVERQLIGTKGAEPIDALTAEDVLFTMEPPHDKALTLEEAKAAEKVFVRSYGFVEVARNLIDGWYSYNTQIRFFIKLDQTFLFPADYYASRFLAFSNPPLR